MMKKILAVVLFSAPATMAFSQSRIRVEVSQFENNKGSCIVCLYDSEQEFSGKGTPLQCITVPVTAKTSTAVFDNIVPGTYAILVVHDANNNRKFDTNFLGIPKEGYGASQNRLPFAAAPKFSDNQFTVSKGETVNCRIRLRYIF